MAGWLVRCSEDSVGVELKSFGRVMGRSKLEDSSSWLGVTWTRFPLGPGETMHGAVQLVAPASQLSSEALWSEVHVWALQKCPRLEFEGTNPQLGRET